MRKIAACKAFNMQSKHVKVNYLLLTRVQSSPGAFIDLLRSVSDAVKYYQAKEGSWTKKLFWSQYTGTEHPVPMSDQLKQLVELHKAAEHAATLKSTKHPKAEAQKSLQEIEAMRKIAAGRAFNMQSKHVKVNYLLLTRVRSSPGAFADLPRGVSDATKFYQAKDGSSIEKLFWS